MIKRSLSPTTPLTPEEQAKVDAWLDRMARMIEAELEQRLFNTYIYGCSHPEMYEDAGPTWPPKLAPP